MTRRKIGLSLMCVVICAGALNLNVWADDSAAAIAAGGLVPRRETRIVMAKEMLKISPTKIVVDYDFRNDTDEIVTTEVAFPIPPYVNGPDEWPAEKASFSDFKLFENGIGIPFKVEARAFLKQADVTAILRSDHIDIATFGHFETLSTGANRIPDLARLPAKEQKRLVGLNIFSLDGGSYATSTWPIANWNVHLQYHWTQTFPARSTIHIRHEYTPVVGFTQIGPSAVDALLRQVQSAENADQIAILRGFCPDKRFLSSLSQALQRSQSLAKTEDEKLTSGVSYPHWVDTILTSANTWKQPIEDFTLIIERGKSELESRGQLISFCSPKNTTVEKVDADNFQVHLTNFVPESELHIGFFDLPKPSKAPPESSKRK